MTKYEEGVTMPDFTEWTEVIKAYSSLGDKGMLHIAEELQEIFNKGVAYGRRTQTVPVDTYKYGSRGADIAVRLWGEPVGLCPPTVVENEEPVEELVQVFNPKSEKWILIDKTKGVILAHRNQDNPFHNIPIATKKDVMYEQE